VVFKVHGSGSEGLALQAFPQILEYSTRGARTGVQIEAEVVRGVGDAEADARGGETPAGGDAGAEARRTDGDGAEAARAGRASSQMHCGVSTGRSHEAIQKTLGR
jgi:hypothetical protein